MYCGLACTVLSPCFLGATARLVPSPRGHGLVDRHTAVDAPMARRAEDIRAEAKLFAVELGVYMEVSTWTYTQTNPDACAYTYAYAYAYA